MNRSHQLEADLVAREAAGLEVPRLVAVSALSGKARSGVVDPGKPSPVVVGLVAAHTLHGGQPEVGVAGVQMTFSAGNCGVRADEGKVGPAVRVGVELGLPVDWGVAALAALAKFSAMGVPVAAGAVPRDGAVEIAGVATLAEHLAVLADQGESGAFVGKCGEEPAAGRVAGLAPGHALAGLGIARRQEERR
jgi:hypothetical protein